MQINKDRPSRRGLRLATPRGRPLPAALRRLRLRVVLFLVMLFAGVPPAAPGEGADAGFSIVVLPDTQIYAWKYPEIFEAQTSWIAANAEARNIRYVFHVGDVVEHNSEKEWRRARKAMSVLDGKVPYAIALGNHDMGPKGSAKNRDSLFGGFFPLEDFRRWPTFAEVYDREPAGPDNSVHRFEAAGRQWLILALEFGPRDDVVRWADEVLARNPGIPTILVTHAYLDADGRRYDRALCGQEYPPQDYPLAADGAGLNTGEEIWTKLVSVHRGVVMVVSGHVCVAARLESRGQAGNVVHQMVVDYQNQKRGGNGWLRLLTFSPDGRYVQVRDYSPVLDEWTDHPDRRFDLALDLP